ncbi:uncharacterized protein TRUGW13939_11774 [Talaromyces rugulosus]|uniref:Choline monooxygenase, chloroplastic n=1 Tax=Talaromyces rugulosus TaxID=121627 RepID=A0A7H8RDQ3_TALRU|nr:uncharacterized protein TRUGW13939_11774 [Talaromyces rugulosus]QKX64599.1 hypothetical protein TRUGW13939_11774 [Talaromyces rugulosus]
MASTLWNLLGVRDTSKAASTNENSPVRALPASWYTSQEMFELERRGIFCKRWLFTTHKARVPNPGDWVRYDVAGFQFIVVKDREGNINAFHNVCRHRGFPVVTGDEGSSKIFACKYHGWSYGLNGKLAKAPSYQGLEGFDKNKNGLFPIHVHVDTNGFVWVNLDAGEKPEIAWEDDFRGIDLQPRFQNYNFEDYVFDHSWEQEGDYNWKILADNYNECYHCPTTHPDIPAVADLSTYSVSTKDGSIIHDAHSTEEQISSGLRVASTYYFPNASMNVSPNFFFMQRFVPVSPTSAVMRYEVYRNKNATDEDFDYVNSMYKRIMSEDKYLCDLTQKNLNRGVFVNGLLHPEKEKGPLYFQKMVRDVVTEHYNREQKAKREIWPARQTLPELSIASEKDIEFCSGLSCNTGNDCPATLDEGIACVPVDDAARELSPEVALQSCLSQLQEKEDPLPWRKAGLLVLRAPQSALFLCHGAPTSGASETSLPTSKKRPIQTTRQEQILEEIKTSLSKSIHPPASGDRRYSVNDSTHPTRFGLEDSNRGTSSLSLSVPKAIDIYFKYWHRQPLWCFNLDELEDQDDLPDELVWSIQALAAPLTQDSDHWQYYANNARGLIMSRVANGTVELSTMESLCLLSYGFFINGEDNLGRFHLSLAIQLCRSAMLDVESTYTNNDPLTERKKRLFWSLQSLEQTYGRQTGLLSISTETWRPWFSTYPKSNKPRPPPLPRDNIGCTTPDDIGIWSMTVYFGWIWSRVRTYVYECSCHRMKEPWFHDSMYAMILSDLMEIENRTPLCHRYESVKFYERKAEELRLHRAYWVPWLKAQFLYHAIHTILNHPFLYIVSSQHNQNLAIPNSFWRRSSELVLLHATWIVRLIDMVQDKQVRMVDPSICHMVAIAATVQLYYCCSADPRLKYKSNVDLAKCRRFLKNFAPLSRACEYLDRTLDKLMSIASGSESMDYEDWMPSKIHLNIPLMWEILQFSCNDNQSSQEMLTSNLLHSSLTPSTAAATIDRDDEMDEDSLTLEIIATTSPEVNVNTADGGQAVPMPFYRPQPVPAVPPGSSATSSTGTKNAMQEKMIAPENLMFTSNTPWLWAEPTQFEDMENMSHLDFQALTGTAGGSAWWDLGNL